MSDDETLDKLRWDGIAPIGSFSATAIGEIRRHLLASPVYNAHVQAKATKPPINCWSALTYKEWPMFCHRMEDVVLLPHLFEAALAIYPLVRDYFDGELPLLYSMNAFWTQPVTNGETYQDTHGWHRDGDDRKQLVMFVYGSDILCDAAGAHIYQKRTHMVDDAHLGRDFRDARDVTAIYGARGTLFLADTGGLHAGQRPQAPQQARLLLWARWGVSDPPQSYVWDKLAPVPKAALGARYPSDPVLQRAVRLVAA